MPLWGLSDASTNAPHYQILSNANGRGADLYQNVTPVGFLAQQTDGVFAVNANGMHGGQVTSPGWVVARQFTGPITSLAVANDGAAYANMSMVTVGNGSATGTGFVVVNATGHVQSITLGQGGAGFINTAAVALGSPANGVATFTIGGGLGYANGETLVVSNGISNATGALTTNATGGITAVTLVAPGWGGRGFAAANSTRAVVTITTVGGTNGNVSVATIGAGAGLVYSVALGGRAGRINYETLVASKYMAATTNSTLFIATT
jgi:hypothetical protein